MFWLDFGARGRENIANSAVLFLVGAKNTVNYNALGALWYLGVRSLWGRKGDHFLPHRELPNMKVALTLGRTGWGRYSGNNNWGFNARCDIFGSGPCGAEKMIISCPTGIYLSCARQHRRFCEAYQYNQMHFQSFFLNVSYPWLLGTD